MSEYLTHDEAAKRVGYSRYVISEWIREGKIERFQRDGKNYFLAEEVDDAAEQRRSARQPVLRGRL